MKRTRKITQKLYIEELERPLQANLWGEVTTLAIGEECLGGKVTTLAIGEEAK